MNTQVTIRLHRWAWHAVSVAAGIQLLYKYRPKHFLPHRYLPGVAHKVFALVPPDPLRRHHEHHHAEHKHHGQPDSPEGRGVFVDSTQKAF